MKLNYFWTVIRKEDMAFGAQIKISSVYSTEKEALKEAELLNEDEGNAEYFVISSEDLEFSFSQAW